MFIICIYSFFESMLNYNQKEEQSKSFKKGDGEYVEEIKCIPDRVL